MTDSQVSQSIDSMPGAAAASAEPSGLLDDRYGRGKQRGIDKRFGWIAAGALLLVGLAFVVFGGWHETSDLEFKALHYEVVDERTVLVEMQVTGPADADIVCAMEALSTSYATVGWKLVELPAGDNRIRRFTTELVTTVPATTGTVRDCWISTL